MFHAVLLQKVITDWIPKWAACVDVYFCILLFFKLKNQSKYKYRVANQKLEWKWRNSSWTGIVRSKQNHFIRWKCFRYVVHYFYPNFKIPFDCVWSYQHHQLCSFFFCLSSLKLFLCTSCHPRRKVIWWLFKQQIGLQLFPPGQYIPHTITF